MRSFPKLPARIVVAALFALPAGLAFHHLAPVALAADEKADEKKADKSELHEHMEAMETAQKKLRRSIKDAAKKEDSLTHLKAFVAAAEASKALTPSETAKKPEADRAKYLEEYKRQMDAVIAVAKKIETAVNAGNVADAEKAFAELKPLEKKGHDEYMPPDEEEKKKPK